MHLDSRTSCKEYKLSDCIVRSCRETLPQGASRLLESRPQPALHIPLYTLQSGRIQTLGDIDRLADHNDYPRQRPRDDEAVPFDLPGPRGGVAQWNHRPARQLGQKHGPGLELPGWAPRTVRRDPGGPALLPRALVET